METRTTSKPFIKNYWQYAVILGMILAVVHMCSNNREMELAGESNILKEQLKKQTAQVEKYKEIRKSLSDSISREKIKSQKKYENLLKLKTKLIYLHKKTEKIVYKDTACNSLLETICVQEQVITEQDSIIKTKDNIIALQEHELGVADETIFAQEEIMTAQNRLIKNAEKQNKQLKTKSTIKDIAIVGLILGLIIK